MKAINKPVEMIAHHTEDGDPKPLKFKIVDEIEAQIVKVDRIVNKEKTKIAGKQVLCYTCISVINNIEKLYELRFFPESMQWVVYKI